MGRASTETLLPIDSWAAMMGISPYWFNQISEGFTTPNDTAQCEHVFYQQSWQRNYLSREEIARCIRQAEGMIAKQLGFYPAPVWITNEQQPYPKPAWRDRSGVGGLNSRWQRKSVTLNWGFVHGGGILARTTINAASAVVLSDGDGDGVNDTFTVTEATTVTDPNEIAVYFVAGDRGNAPLGETWRIRPVNVVISGGTATITGHSSLMVSPTKTTGVNPQPLDVTAAAIYATTVEVQRVYRNDGTTNNEQGFSVWENGGCANPPCASSYGSLCIGSRDDEYGIVTVDYAPGDTCPSYEPDRVIVNYLAGVPLVNGNMNPEYADIVAKLATALLPVEACGCERAERLIAYWRDVPPAGGEGLRTALVGDLGASPFGPQRGAIYAWQQVRMLKHLT